MPKYRVWAAVVLIVGVGVAFFVYQSEKNGGRFRFKLGLDLNGGTHLVYKADVSTLEQSDISGAMESLRDTIERRVNLFGVSEPIVQIEGTGAFSREHKLIVELPGVTDINRAVELIGLTPTLEFRLLDEAVARELEGRAPASTTEGDLGRLYRETGLTGAFLKRADVQFDQTSSAPIVNLTFNDEGADLFAKITRENIGKKLAIFLDGALLSSPVIQDEITGGKAVISGDFSLDEAKMLVRNLNYGALPMPIELVGTQKIGASLGTEAVAASLRAGLWGFAVVALFLILWYRLPGVVATLALALYIALNLAIFKLIPVTLTSTGIAGFILSLGMAVDANILIFERTREELLRGRTLEEAMKEGFTRAWASIRDSNLSSIITAVILYYFASTNIVRGFALVFFIGVIVSMFTAITASRLILYALGRAGTSPRFRFLFSSGLPPLTNRR